MKLVFLIVMAVFIMAQSPYDFRQDKDIDKQENRFDNFIMSNGQLSKQDRDKITDIGTEIAVVKERVNYTLGILGAIGLSFLGVIINWLRKRLFS